MEGLMESYFTPLVPMDFGYQYRLGAYLERYLDGLRERKILGVRCEGCGDVMVPPRMYCGKCRRKLEEWIEVKDRGELVEFTVGHVIMSKGKLSPSDPYIIGLVRLDGATHPLLARIQGVEVSSLRPGMRLRAHWNEAAENDYFVLDHFGPE